MNMFVFLASVTALLFWIIGMMMWFKKWPKPEQNIMSVPMGAFFIAVGILLAWLVSAS